MKLVFWRLLVLISVFSVECHWFLCNVCLLSRFAGWGSLLWLVRYSLCLQNGTCSDHKLFPTCRTQVSHPRVQQSTASRRSAAFSSLCTGLRSPPTYRVRRSLRGFGRFEEERQTWKLRYWLDVLILSKEVLFVHKHVNGRNDAEERPTFAEY